MVLMRSSFLPSECKAVAAQAPEIAVTWRGSFDASQESVTRMETAKRSRLSATLMLGDRYAGASGFANVERSAIASIDLDW